MYVQKRGFQNLWVLTGMLLSLWAGGVLAQPVTGPADSSKTVIPASLYVDDDVVASGPMRTQQAQFTLCGDGLCIGRDSADAVSKEYRSPARFKGGTIMEVEVNVGDDRYVDLERQAAAMMARE